MPGLTEDSSLEDYQEFNDQVYRQPNDRHFSLQDLVNNLERFTMRGLKGIRKDEKEKTIQNLLIASSWFMSIINRLDIDIEQKTFERFPYKCSYCGSCPCSCGEDKPDERAEPEPDFAKKPENLQEFQEMFGEIYPAEKRTLDHAGVHLAEEVGELAEALMAYRGTHEEDIIDEIKLEAADFLSCLFGVFNSYDVSMGERLAEMFSDNCHVCNDAPCTCDYFSVIGYES